MTKFTIDRRSLLRTGGALLAGAATGLSTTGAARSQSTQAPTKQAQETAAPLTRNTDVVRIGYGRGGLTLIAKQRGTFEARLARQGIKVEWVGPFPNHAPSMQAVVGGSADFGFWGSTTPAFAAMLAGAPLVFNGFNVYDPRSTAIIVKKTSGIDSVADLVGRSVAVNRSGLGEFLLVAALEQNGIDRDAVNFVYLNPPDAAPAFAQGKVDAWSMWSPAVDISRVDNDAKDIFNEGKDLEFLIDFASLVTRRSFSEENSELVRAVLDAYYAEGAWTDLNPDEAERIAQAEGNYADEARDYLAGLKRVNRFHEPDDAQFMANLQRAADWLAERAIIKAPITVADHSIQIPRSVA